MKIDFKQFYLSVFMAAGMAVMFFITGLSFLRVFAEIAIFFHKTVDLNFSFNFFWFYAVVAVFFLLNRYVFKIEFSN